MRRPYGADSHYVSSTLTELEEIAAEIQPGTPWSDFGDPVTDLGGLVLFATRLVYAYGSCSDILVAHIYGVRRQDVVLMPPRSTRVGLAEARERGWCAGLYGAVIEERLSRMRAAMERP